MDTDNTFTSAQAAHMMMGAATLEWESGLQHSVQNAALKKEARQLEELRQAALAQPGERDRQQLDRLEEWLGQVEEFKLMQRGLIRELAQAVEARRAAPGDMVVDGGDVITHLLVVLEGRLQVVTSWLGDYQEEEGVLEYIEGEMYNASATEHGREYQRHEHKIIAPEATFLLAIPHDEYDLILAGQVSRQFEEKMDFLLSLNLLRGVPRDTLRVMCPLFRLTMHEPKDLLIRQGDVADHMLVVKSGQCCVLVDSNYSSDSPLPSETDPSKCIQICILGTGSVLGDMTILTRSRRTASVLALTEMVTYRINNTDFRRRAPPDVMEMLRRVAGSKAAMTKDHVDQKANKGMVGYVVLGSSAFPERVLRGYHLRCLEATEADAWGKGGGGRGAAALDPEFQSFLDSLPEAKPPSIERLRASSSRPSKCARLPCQFSRARTSVGTELAKSLST